MNRIVAIFIIYMCIAMFAQAQSACDKYYAAAVKYQQTMTIASQNKAIAYFEKAKNCYDSQHRKQLCESQIATCKKTIMLIKKKQHYANQKSVSEKVEDGRKTVVHDNKAKEKVVLTTSETILKFKPKGGEFLKFKVDCNYEGWKVVEKPDWISCSVNGNHEVVCEAAKNSGKGERHGMIVIECRGKRVSVAVLQSKKGLLGNILK